jgi:hypothetical protein
MAQTTILKKKKGTGNIFKPTGEDGTGAFVKNFQR